MKQCIKYQVAALQKAADEIERSVDILAQKIFVDHIDYALAMAMRDEIFLFIDKTKEVYKSVFAFNVAYPEQRSLDILKDDINEWFKLSYEEDA